MKHRLLNIVAVACMAAATATQAVAQIPAGYYKSLKGKKGAELKTAIHDLVKEANVLGYGSGSGKTWWGFYVTDNIDGKVVDRYSNNTYTFGNRGTSVSGMNIEHSFPKSWWGGKETQAYKDLFNLMPSDAKANSSKSNYGMGMVTQAPGTKGYYDNDCIKVGTCDQGFKVWQPSAQWEGDFARDYMYMATAYQDYTWDTGNDAQYSLEQNEWPTLKEWAYTLYIHWAKEDPVSDIEVKRNNAVYSIQGNRNPYVDYPNLMEYVWGDSIDVAFDPDTSIKSSTVTDGPITPDNPDGTVTLYSRNFKSTSGDCTTTTATAPSSGKDVWTRDVKYGWVATAFSGKAYAADASLVTPEIDMSGMQEATLTFKHAVNYCSGTPSSSLSVEVLCDGNATKLDGITWPAGTDWKFVSSGSIDLTPYVGKRVSIAFHYTSTTSNACTWEISEAEINAKRANSGISQAAMPSANGFDPTKPYEIYSLSGMRLSSATGHGVVIVRQGGKSWKVVDK